jgi:hypothetical protein
MLQNSLWIKWRILFLVLPFTILFVLCKSLFVPAAYAILELFTAATIFALLFVNGDSFARDLIISASLFTAFIYLQLLIRDLDNPFDYNGRSSADVALSIVTITLKKLKQF